MIGTSRQLVVVMWMGVAVLPTAQAIAQEPKAEVAVVYSWEDDHGLKYPLGWTASVAANLNSRLAVVAEIGGNYDFERVPDLPGYTHRNEPYTISNLTFSAGPRFGLGLSPRV